MSVRVRFAPSPTGFVHIGSLRTALYDFLLARKTKGSYILRVEDTDRQRFIEGAIEGMLSAMDWAGVHHDEGVDIDAEGKVISRGDCGPYIQSERLPIYKEYIGQLLEKGSAYYCFCTKEELDEAREKQKTEGVDPKYDGRCRELTKEQIEENLRKNIPYVIRMKLPENKDIVFDDAVRGRVSINTNDMDDQVLMKSDGFPTYHFAVVVDDHLMGITHVIRGEEWLPSTPKQVFLYEAFGWEVPTFVHLPNILNPDKKKLSKRQGDVAVEDFRKKGYLPEALVNYVALVGWSPEDNREIFSMQELIEAFSLERVSRSGGVFDVMKLNWFNNHYIKSYDIDKLVDLALPFIIESGLMNETQAAAKRDWIRMAMETFRERLDYLAQFPEEIKVLLSDDIYEYEQEALDFMALPHMKQLHDVLAEKLKAVEALTPEAVSSMLKEIQKETGIKGKPLFMGSRVLFTGQNHGPDLPLMLTLIGKDKLLKRLAHANESLL